MHRVLALVAVVLVGLVAVVAADLDGWEWRWAQSRNTITAYEGFLDRYATSAHSEAATAKLQTLYAERDWSEIKTTPTAAGLAAFLAQYPASEHGEKARHRLQGLLLEAASEQYRESDVGSRSVEEVRALATLALHEMPSSLEDYQTAVDIWVEVLSRPESASLRSSIAGIQPDTRGPPVRLDASAMSDQASARFKFSTSQTLTTSEVSEFAAEGMILPPDGQLRNAIALGRGSHFFSSYTSRLDGSTGNAAFATTGLSPRFLKAYAELPKEWVYLEGMWSGNARVLIPNGPGTVLRFLGDVDGLFPGYRFNGADDYPLTFVLLPDTGLTYVCGKGSVVDSSGREWSFSPVPKEANVNGAPLHSRQLVEE